MKDFNKLTRIPQVQIAIAVTRYRLAFGIKGERSNKTRLGMFLKCMNLYLNYKGIYFGK